MEKLKIIGLTGAIGSGKSFVAHIFETFQIPIYNSDYWAKQLVTQNKNVRQKIKTLLGENSYHTDGSYNTVYVSNMVFNNNELLQQLNEIIHPAVAKHFEQFVAQNAQASYVIKETALLFEKNIYKQCQANICVVAPLEIRIQRVLQRDNTTREQILKRMNSQWSQEEKVQKADYIIHNDGEQLLLPQILQIHQALLLL